MKEQRAALLADPALRGGALRAALVEPYDTELAGLLRTPGPGVALVAVGGPGRREIAPGSDLDLLLLHDGRPDVAAVADALWHPLWDSGVALDHAVRTVDEALAVAAEDLEAALGLLDARHVAGDRALSAQLLARTRVAWRVTSARRLPELRSAVVERARAEGEVAYRSRRVHRPDLLLLGALLQDIGKGRPGDHTVVGMEVVADLAPRLGLPPADVAVLVALVEHHLLLPDVATRRDLDDPATARGVADAVGSVEVLELLHAVSEADAQATGPAAWSPWKARLVDDLVRRTAALLAGAGPPAPAPLTPEQAALVEAGAYALVASGERGDGRGPRPAGAARGCHRSAGPAPAGRAVRVRPHARDDGRGGGTGGATFRVVAGLDRRARRPAPGARRRARPRGAARRARGGVPAPSRAAPRAAGRRAGRRRVADGDRDRGPRAGRRRRAARITAALARCGLDVRSAHISTLGRDVVDAFYVVGPDGGPLQDPLLRSRVREQVVGVLSSGDGTSDTRARGRSGTRLEGPSPNS